MAIDGTSDRSSDAANAAARAAAVGLKEPAPETFPRRFGPFTLVAPIARGGMGEVFLGKTGGVIGMEKRCVVKTLRPHLTDDREYVARFVDEARIVVQLSHRNICQVFDVGTVGERYYLAMEYIAGRDLKSLAWRAPGQRLDPALAIHVVCEVLDALDYAHRLTDATTSAPMLLVHRDISPQNVMVSFDGEVKLIDFGLAASALKLEQTQPNVVMGKLAYMSPEQVRGEKVDARTDQFAAAVCLYELLVGERFYDGRSPYEIWGLAAQGSFRPRLWDELQPELKEILDTALSSLPETRFPDCNALREALVAHRFAHGYRSDTRALRDLVQQVFPDEIEENRQLLAMLSQSRLPGESGKTAAFIPEPTQSIAHTRVLPANVAVTPVKEPTEPTGIQQAVSFFPPVKLPLLAMASGLLTLFVLVALSWPSAPQAGTAPVPASPPAPMLVADVAPEVAPQVEPPAAPAVVVEDVVVASAQKPSRPRSRSSASIAKAEPTSPPTPEPTVAAAAPRYDPDLPKGERVRLLRAHCQDPCVEKVGADYDGKAWLADPRGFADALRSCWVAACALPH